MTYRKRVAYASFDAVIAAIVFVIIPLYLLPMIERYFGVNVPLYSLPYLGLMMVAASFFSGFSKNTKYEGAAVIVWSLVTIIYLAYVFWGGKFEASATTFSGETIYVGIAFPIIYYIMLAIPAIGIARGAAMLASYRSTVMKSSYVPVEEEQKDMLPPHTD